MLRIGLTALVAWEAPKTTSTEDVMLTHYYQSGQFLVRRFDDLAGAHLERFAQELYDAGYARTTACRHLRAAQHVLYWTGHKGIAVADLDDTVIQRFEHHLPRCRCRSYGRRDRSLVRGVRLFVDSLRGNGVVHTSNAKSVGQPPSVLLAAFQQWMRDNRNISEPTLYNYGLGVADLLQTLGENPQNFDALRLREFVLKRSQQCGIAKVKQMVTALRAFVRFLAAEGHCPAGLQAAIPSLAQWHLSDLPRYLQPEEVERVIAACNPSTVTGLRDRSIVLLLARLALRAGDIVTLQLADIDWTSATVRVSGKGRRETHLPLSQEVGDAIVGYLTKGRPKTDTDRLFVRSRAPFRSFASHAAVSMIVAKAMRRAGVAPAARGAAHVLRHSAATTMLRRGASLYEVATVLRHRSTETTTIYAKVDVGALQQVAQPWPEVPSC